MDRAGECQPRHDIRKEWTDLEGNGMDFDEHFRRFQLRDRCLDQGQIVETIGLVL